MFHYDGALSLSLNNGFKCREGLLYSVKPFSLSLPLTPCISATNQN